MAEKQNTSSDPKTITFRGVVIPDFTDPVASARAWADLCDKAKQEKEAKESALKALGLASEALAVVCKTKF